MDSTIVTLKFDGLEFDFWQRSAVRMSVDDLAASVEFSFANSSLGTNFPVNVNTVAQVLFNDELVATVRPDSAPRRIGPNQRSYSFNGRSLGRELIDTQYSVTLKKNTVTDIVKHVCNVFKVPLIPIQNTQLVPDFSMQSESPANAILNAARTANLLIYPTPDGGLIMAEPDNSEPIATLVMGEQIQELAINDDFRQLYSEYQVKSFDYNANVSRRGAVTDGQLNFYRPMHVIADRMGNSLGALQRRAEMERNRRMARAHSRIVTVTGHGCEYDGKLRPWPLNRQVRVVVPDEGIDQVMLIIDLEFTQDDQQGTHTALTVVHRDALVGQTPTVKKKSAASRKAKARP